MLCACMVMAAMGVVRLTVLLSLFLGCACERLERSRNASWHFEGAYSRLITLGYNDWANFAVAPDGKAICNETSCQPILVQRIFQAPVVELGATWTHVLDEGKLYSSGWAGDGACGFSPNEETHHMKGEYVTELVDASDRWDQVDNSDQQDNVPKKKWEQRSDHMTGDLHETAFADEIAACDGAELDLISASAAYTSSLLLSRNRRCVFTFGLVGDDPTNTLAIPKRYQGTSGTVKRPLAIFHSPATNKVRQVVATWGGNFLVMDSGEVLRTPPAFSAAPVSRTLSWQAVAGLRNVTKMAGNGWAYYGAMTANGDLRLWSDKYVSLPTRNLSASPHSPNSESTQAPAVVMQGVADFSLGPEHMLVLKPDGDSGAFTLWSAGSNACGQLGRKTLQSKDQNLGQVPGLWTAACAGFYFSLGLNDTGIYIWGSIGEGACNEPGKTHVFAPMLLKDYFRVKDDVFEGFPKVDSITCGFYTAAAVVRSS